MKRVMQQFEDRTTQRFHEYDERMKTTRQKCKEKCNKEIQKIILKDKLEKQMVEQFSTLQTDIQSNAIPTCICEKSLADKVEKGCLRCAGVLGGGVMPGMGLIDGSLLGAISVLKPLALKAATEEAIAEATKAATNAGIEAVKLKIQGLIDAFRKDQVCVDLRQIVTSSTYNNGDALLQSAEELIGNSCMIDNGGSNSFYTTATRPGKYYIKGFAQAGSDAYQTTLTTETPALTEAKVGAVEATYASYHISIIASIVAIVVIVIIMVIIYKILRYRRKKKMKKKLQYIKLLEE
ncbi:surface antigen [Plasmodium falciparum UGT5.1]|uniref:Surface antigen n=1 Tax=Plasmodium falciparum UGT5.1 TaxID=1237627 RepID=W7JRH6_PLAFA|nr:surface antigen [Plasmodium falciparum UGT5.1]